MRMFDEANIENSAVTRIFFQISREIVGAMKSLRVESYTKIYMVTVESGICAEQERSSRQLLMAIQRRVTNFLYIVRAVMIDTEISVSLFTNYRRKDTIPAFYSRN